MVSSYVPSMARKPYRVEINYTKTGRKRYFLVKDVKFAGKRRKARLYISSRELPPEEVEIFRKEHAPDMEERAAKKKAELSREYYESEYLTKEQITQIEQIRHMYKAMTDLMTTNEIEAYEKDFEIQYIHGTTSIEGNTLTVGETKKLLNYGITPSKKNLREINEVQNFQSVVAYRDKYKGRVTPEFVRTLHALVMQNIDHDSAGQFRRVDNVIVTNSDLRPTPSALVEVEMQEAMTDYYTRLKSKGHPFELAVLFHHKLESIHPFTDGNGRVGREVLNFMLRRSKYPRLLFLGTDRDLYLNALKSGDEGDRGSLVETFASLIMKQRQGVIQTNLRRLASHQKFKRQTRLEDYVRIAKQRDTGGILH